MLTDYAQFCSLLKLSPNIIKLILVKTWSHVTRNVEKKAY